MIISRQAFCTLALYAAIASSTLAETRTIETTLTIDLLDRMALSASVDGVIQKVTVRAGDRIAKGQTLVQLDTERLEKQLSVAEQEYLALKIKSENNSREQVSLARERSAKFNVDKLNEVAAHYRVSVPALEMTRAVSDLQEATSEKEGARLELSQFLYEAKAKQREIELLKYDIQVSNISSQFDGALTQVDKHAGEYVQKGETIAELYRLDRLAGVVLISRDELLPEEAENVVGMLIVRDKVTTNSYKIKIRRVLPRVDIDGKYRACVELENEKTEDGKWRLLPGMVGQAIFELKEPGKSAVAALKVQK